MSSKVRPVVTEEVRDSLLTDNHSCQVDPVRRKAPETLIYFQTQQSRPREGLDRFGSSDEYLTCFISDYLESYLYYELLHRNIANKIFILQICEDILFKMNKFCSFSMNYDKLSKIWLASSANVKSPYPNPTCSPRALNCNTFKTPNCLNNTLRQGISKPEVFWVLLSVICLDLRCMVLLKTWNLRPN